MKLSAKLVSIVGTAAILAALIGLGAVGNAPGSDAVEVTPPQTASAGEAGVPESAEESSLSLAQNDELPAADAESSADLGEQLETIASELDELARSVNRNGKAVQDSRDNSRETVEELRAEIEALRKQLEGQTTVASGGEPNSALAADDAPADADSARKEVPQPTGNRRIEEALQSTTTLEFPGNPLRDVLEYISIIHDFPIIIDEVALQLDGVTPDEEVHLVLSDIELRNALEIMLHKVAGVELDYVVGNEVLTVTTREKADTIHETRVYDLRGLAHVGSPQELSQVIRNSISPESWRTPGVVRISPAASEQGEEQPDEKNAEGAIEALNDALVVTQSQRVHREISDLLRQLGWRSTSDQTASGYSPYRWILSLKVNEDFSATTFSGALQHLREKYGLNIVLHDAAREALDLDKSLEFSVRRMNLRMLLYLLLMEVSGDDIALTSVIEGDVIRITPTNDDTTARHTDAGGTQALNHSAAAQQLREQLDGRVQVRIVEGRLRDVLQSLTEQQEVSVVIDEVALAEVGVTPDRFVPVNIKGVTLQSALRLIVDPSGRRPITFVLEDDVIKITTKQRAAEINAGTGESALD